MILLKFAVNFELVTTVVGNKLFNKVGKQYIINSSIRVEVLNVE